METEATFLEKQYVHSVYEKTAPYLSQLQGKAWPRVREFLLRQKPGSLVADIGCGAGKYLDVNREVYMVGCDLCGPLVAKARKHGNEVLVCDNLQLPFRDRVFRAVISIGVVHHFSTPERRIRAIREMARTMAPGGQLMIYVWAQEQKHRRFPKQDVLVPWNKALCFRSSSESGGSGSGRGRTLLLEDGRRSDTSGGEFGDRRTCSLGNCAAAVGNRCLGGFRLLSDRGPRPCLQRALRSWFFSRSLDEPGMRQCVESVGPRTGLPPPRRVGSAVLVQPTGLLGDPPLRQPSLEEDDVFTEAVSQGEGGGEEEEEEEEEEWAKEVNSNTRRLPAVVRSTNDLNHAKARASPLSSTDSILETVSVDGSDGDLADSKDLMRYYHVFRGGELACLIEENVPELSVLSSCLDHGNWCVIAKKTALS